MDLTVEPSSIRTEFEDIVIRDLHGPFDGPEEILPEEPIPRDRYLVGILAPSQAYVDPNRFDEPTAGTNDEALAETKTPAPQMMPSALGLTLVVDSSAPELLVSADWGHYRKVEHDRSELAGRPGFKRILEQDKERQTFRTWQRSTAGGKATVALHDDAPIDPTVPDRHFPGVIIRGRVRRTADVRIVTLFLVNTQPAPHHGIDEACLFQVSLAVEAPDGAAIFVDRSSLLVQQSVTQDADETASLAMLYRHEVEFGVGHGAAVHAVPSEHDPRRAVRLETVNVPRYELPRTEAPHAAEIPGLAALELDMKAIAGLADHELGRALEPLVRAYRTWIDEQRQRMDDPAARLASHRTTAQTHLRAASEAADRIAAGIALLARDHNAAEAFRFANEAMGLQRVRQTALFERAKGGDVASRAMDDAIAAADRPENRSWRVFQLAFLLLNLPSLTEPLHPERAADTAVADLLFFPTGGGKTEAYLGLAAFTLAIRRLQGTLRGDDGDLDGSGGVAVLMRYTLRLLTAQQFQRAAGLVAACEVLRRERYAKDPRWGETPFRLGLFIGGRSTPNSTEEAHRAIETARQRSGHTGGYADPLKITACPWCGTPLDIGRDVYADRVHARTIFVCPDQTFGCPFTLRNSSGDGIPVVTVDEEIYRLLPGFVIATVDKFAQLPWQGPMHTLFGRVSRRCERHGYRSFDLTKVGSSEERDSHNAGNGHPAARTVSCLRLRPPDLIIQDELHLISGPLGTLVGLYETAIDRLCSARVDGKVFRPKVVASTATIRRAPRQVQAVFNRSLRVFPPPGLDVGDSFFARMQPPSQRAPGRLYVGICARGQRLKAAEARVAISVLAAAQVVHEKHGGDADPYMTMLAYFNSIRELAGMRRLLDDDVRMRLPKAADRGLARRRTPLMVRELTSRISADEIIEVLDRLNHVHDPAEKRNGADRPLDVVLATNMISVGVDVPRLGLMVVTGQPKTTAEYIQATSRIGRSERGPGVVFTIYNWTRPRDLSHYERFEFDHATFYQQVEPLSVTPFAARALDRGLTGVLVGLVRHEYAHQVLGGNTNPDRAAQSVPVTDASLSALVEYLEARAAETAGRPAGAQVGAWARERLDRWLGRQRFQQQTGSPLSYAGRTAQTRPLLDDGLVTSWNPWSAPRSLRDVEREINLLIDTTDSSVAEARTFERAPTSAQGPPASFEDEPTDAVDAEAQES